jgi:hypothetical protein
MAAQTGMPDQIGMPSWTGRSAYPDTPPAHSTPHAGQAVAPASFGIPSGPGPGGTQPPAPTRRRRPVMLLAGAAARCPRSPECWAGLVVTSGSASARSLPCTRPHVWQTFAVAILPAGVRTFDAGTVAANSTVSAVCSIRVLLASRQGAARQLPAGSWQIAVLPPDEAAFGSGARAYRCLGASRSGAESSASQFGPPADQGGRAEHGGGGRGRGKNG